MSNISFFVSSTFNDMQSERDIIRDRIAPEIDERIKRYGQNLEFIDLRWGIDTKGENENDANAKILRTCFDEIQKTKPYFVALIGERYGWIPDADDVTAALLDNGVEVTDELLNKSITELEIECALRSYPFMDRCVFYFRDEIDYGSDEQAKKNFVSHGKDKEKVALLKKKLTELYPKQIRTYSAKWNKELQRIEGLEEFGKSLFNDVITTLETDLEKTAAPQNPIEESLNVQKGLIDRLSATFSGRSPELRLIDEFSRSDKCVMLLTGQSGSGKSSLLAKAVTLLSDNACVLPFFVGADENACSVENMLKSIVFVLSEKLNAPLCFQPNERECDYGAILKQFYSLINTAALDRDVYLVIDAINQFARTPYEADMKWLNLHSLNPNVKLIISSTPDYYQLRFIEALRPMSVNLDYFTLDDVESVARRYFKINHKEINDAVLKEITLKGGDKYNPCREPIYLLSLLQELTNIGKEDFREIKRREAALGENAGDAIINYLADIARNAPNKLNLQLETLYGKICSLIGERETALYVCSIAVSRQGMDEKFIEKISEKIGVPFHSATFSYFRKLLKNDLYQRENGKWEFSHALVKNYYRSRFDRQYVDSILSAVIDRLDETDDDNSFKKTEYAYYLTMANKPELFTAYYCRMKNDDQVRNSLVNELQQLDARSDVPSRLLAPNGTPCKEMWTFFYETIENGLYAPQNSEAYACAALNSIYLTEYANDEQALYAIFRVYYALGQVAVRSGYYNAAKDYLHMALSIVSQRTESYKVRLYALLADCYYNTGDSLSERKYDNLREKELLASEPSAKQTQELLHYLYEDSLQKVQGILPWRKTVTAHLNKMQSLLQLNLLDEQETCLWIAKILRIVSRFAMPKGQYDDETARAIKFADEAPSLLGAECLYAAALYTANSDTTKAYELAQKSHAKITEALKTDNGAETLALSNEILNLLIYFADVFKDNDTELIKQRAETLARLNLLAPTYETVCEEIRLLKKEENGEIKTKKLKTSKKLRRESSREQVTAEQKAVNKILLLIVAGVLAVFAVGMPIFFSLMRSSIHTVFGYGSTPYYLFINFFVEALFETFFNMFFCFGAYGLLQILYPASDYKKRKIWIKRSAVFFALAAIVTIVYALVWNHNYETNIITSGNFENYEIYVMSLLVTEMMLVMMTLNEAMSFATYERPLTSQADNRERFVNNLRANLLNALIKLLMLGVCVTVYRLAYAYLNANYTQRLADSLLIFSNALYYSFAGAIAFVIIAKAVYFILEYSRRKHGKAPR